MHVSKYLTEFCTGCGLCHSLYGIEMNKDELGFIQPEINRGGDKSVS